jgi:deoxyribonuclease-4
MRLGAHLSIEKGYIGALEKAKTIGANCLQIFSTSPRGWKADYPKFAKLYLKEFQATQTKLDIAPVYFHASYLINLADANQIGFLSKKQLVKELLIADMFGIKGTIIHTGSFKTEQPNYLKLKDNLNYILERISQNVLLIIENAGNRKIGQTIEQIGYIVKLVKDKRLKVCLDTCHLHAAGYDISSKQSLDKFLKAFDKEVGLEKLELWHVNDSKDAFGSLRDRHENIGQGFIGLKVFETLFNHSQTKDYPFIIEVPGFDNNGPDKQNLDILKTLV